MIFADLPRPFLLGLRALLDAALEEPRSEAAADAQPTPVPDPMALAAELADAFAADPLGAVAALAQVTPFPAARAVGEPPVPPEEERAPGLPVSLDAGPGVDRAGMAWSPAEDLALVSALLQGESLPLVLARLGRGQAEALARFDTLVPDQSRDGRRRARERLIAPAELVAS